MEDERDSIANETMVIDLGVKSKQLSLEETNVE